MSEQEQILKITYYLYQWIHITLIVQQSLISFDFDHVRFDDYCTYVLINVNHQKNYWVD